MKIAHVLLCSFANITKSGSLNALDVGLFEKISSRTLPVHLPHISIAMGLITEPGDASKEFDVYLSFWGPDNLQIGNKLRTRIETVPAPLFTDGVFMWSVGTFNGVHFPGRGKYEFRVELNGKSLSAFVDIHVVPDR